MNTKKITAMREGGKKLARVKQAVITAVKPGVTFEQLESIAQSEIAKAGAKPSFSTVSGYHWATCIMKNEELCHGIPKDKTVNPGDVITVDVGLINQGYHLDTTTTVAVEPVTKEIADFLAVGKKSVEKAISKVKPGANVYEISRAMQKVVQNAGFGVVYQLTGHGVGEQLHMDPSIPCVAQKNDKKVTIKEGQTLAIEIMYTAGDPHLVLDKDGWTYKTEDGSLSGMFEETVLVTESGFEVLTGIK